MMLAATQVSSLARLLSVTELIHAIIDNLNEPADLRNVRLVSRRFNDLAAAVIYRSLHLDFSPEYFLSTLRFIGSKGGLRPYLSLVQELSVSFGPTQSTHLKDEKGSKAFRYRCVVIIDLLQTLPALRKFRWLALDPISEELLDALRSHRNAPSLDLQQHISVAHRCSPDLPPFAKIASMPKLKALRMIMDMKKAQSSLISGLIKALFGVINAHLHQLEELELSITIPVHSELIPALSGWNLVARAGFTNTLIQQAQRNGGTFSALRSLSIKSNAGMFSMHEGQPIGLACLWYYSYPVLQDLTLKVSCSAVFLNQLTSQHTGPKIFHFSSFPNSGWGKDNLAAKNFLESYSGLESCTINLTSLHAESLTLLIAVVKEHGGTLEHLRVMAASDFGLYETGKILEFCTLIRHIGGGLPRLQRLELPLASLENLDELPSLKCPVSLRVLGFYLNPGEELPSSEHNRPPPPELSHPYFGKNSQDLLSHGSHLEKIVVYPSARSHNSLCHPSPIYTISKDPLSNEVVWRGHSREAQESRLRWWAKELGEQPIQMESEAARNHEEARLKLALLAADQMAIDEWDSGSD